MGCALLFLVFASTFNSLRGILGAGATAFSLIPVMVTAWLFGIMPGLVSALATILITGGIVCAMEAKTFLAVMQEGGTAGFLTTVVAVIITGHFRGLQQRLRHELVERGKTEEALRQNEKIFQRIFDQSPIGAAIVTLEYRYESANQAFCQMVGYSEEQLLQHTFMDITDPDCVAEEFRLIKMLETGEIEHVQMDKRYIHQSGEIIWVHLSICLIRNSSGEALYFFPMMVDITERKKAETSLAKEASINAALVDLSHVMMAETSLIDIPGRVLEHAMRLTKSEIGFVGYIDPQTGSLISSHHSADASSVETNANPTQVFYVFTGLWGWVLKNKKSLISNHPANDPRSSGVPAGHTPIRRFLSVPAIVDDNLVGQIALANAPQDYTAADLDITQRLATLYGAAVYQQQLKEKFHFLSMHDPMTGLHNRRYYEEALHQLKEARHFPVSIIMCDIDRLKNVNDQNGHADGDEVLRRAARLLRSAFRVEDIVARIGGDEFVVVLAHTPAEAAAEAIRRVSALIDLDNIKSPPPPVLVSLGIATAQNKEQLGEAVKKADAAMYLEKQNRRQIIAQANEAPTLPIQSFSE